MLALKPGILASVRMNGLEMVERRILVRAILCVRDVMAQKITSVLPVYKMRLSTKKESVNARKIGSVMHVRSTLAIA